MSAALVAWSARHPWVAICATLLLAVAGGFCARALSRDVVPDLSDPQIAVEATWMGRSATEVDTDVTRVLTLALDGVPGSRGVRAVSMPGMSYVDVVFASSSSLAAGRRDIADRVSAARGRLPSGVRVEIGPAASSTSWVFQYALVDRSRSESLLSLRRMQDGVLRPALAALPGVVEVASLGGGAQQARVEARTAQLEAGGIAFSDVASVVAASLTAAPTTFDSLHGITIPRSDGSSARLDEVANVFIADEMPSGVADLGGASEVVGGIVLAGADADVVSLVDGVKRTLAAERSRLPPGVEVVTVYDRTELANRTHRNLVRALGEEIIVAVVVILVFLLHGRSALVPLATLPVVVLLTLGAMRILDVPATIMSLGGIGIALGLAVDADVVALEACHRRMQGLAGSEGRRKELVLAAGPLAPAITTSLLVTAVAFLPVFAFTGETGRLLRPLAVTKTLLVASAAIVSLAFAPALRDRLLHGRVVAEFDNPLTRALVCLYRPVVHFALDRPALTIGTAMLALVSCVPIATRLGGEFLPQIDEGDLLFMPSTLPDVRAERAASELRQQDRAIAAFPEVDTVFGKVGRADTATDPAPFAMAETIVRLKPRSEWPTVAHTRWYSRWAPPVVARILAWFWPDRATVTTGELVDALDAASRRPGWTSAWTAPARARMQMMSTGIRTPVGIGVVASDPTRLEQLGTALRAIALRVPGARSAVLESLGGEERLRFAPDPVAVARLGLDAALVQSTAERVVSGGLVGETMHDGRPLRVYVTPGAPGLRGPADELRDVTVRSTGGGGQPVPLALVGRPVYDVAPALLRTVNGERIAYVYVDLERGVDPVGYVDAAQREVDRAVGSSQIRLGAGERIEWAGQYRLFAEGARRLRWIGLAVIVAVLGLLTLQFRSLTEALIVATAVPFALVGSVWTLFVLGYPLSAPVWVGLLSVIGLATQTGVVMVVYIDESFYARVREGRIRSREDIVMAHAEGTVRRLRPKMMTVTTMAAALLPLLWSDGAGAEIMKRVAAPMVGGIVTSAFLTLEVLPVVYTIWRNRQLLRARATSTSIEQVVGTVPTWAR